MRVTSAGHGGVAVGSAALHAPRESEAMIIAIASDDGIHVAEHPDRCGGFVVFEVGRGSAVRVGYRTNIGFRGRPQQASDGPSTGHERRAEAPLAGALSDCQAVVSRQVSELVVQELSEAEIDAYGCPPVGVDEAAGLFARDQLEKAAPHVCWSDR